MFGFAKSPTFVPDRDIPSLSGKTIIITGGTSGLGREHLLQFAKHSPGKLYLAARSWERAKKTIDEISSMVGEGCPPIYFLHVDLSSFTSIQAATSQFLECNDRLDILVNNAGVLTPPASLTSDGFEVTFGTNYMGPFFFTRQLLPLLIKTAADPKADVRIVNITSSGYKFAPKGGVITEKCTTPMTEFGGFPKYGQSKLALLLFGTELAKRYPQITSIPLHPSLAATGISDDFQRRTLPRILRPIYAFMLRLFLKTVPDGTQNQMWACVAPVEGKEKLNDSPTLPRIRNGEYYIPVGKVGPRTNDSKDDKLAEHLWDWSENQVMNKGY
ncbi:MAG: hypothetical protein Q9160_005145 [Pyrenula sp. 1 TL-2023]